MNWKRYGKTYYCDLPEHRFSAEKISGAWELCIAGAHLAWCKRLKDAKALAAKIYDAIKEHGE